MKGGIEAARRSPFVNLLGLAIEKQEEGHCKSSLKIKDFFLNGKKFVHGGIIYSVADISMALAVYSTLNEDEDTATIEIKINYLKPADTKILFCDANMIQKGKNIAVLEAKIKYDDNLIAIAQGTFSIYKRRRSDP